MALTNDITCQPDESELVPVSEVEFKGADVKVFHGIVRGDGKDRHTICISIAVNGKVHYVSGYLTMPPAEWTADEQE